TSSSTTQSSSSAVGPASSTGAGGGNHSFSTATVITVNAPPELGVLPDPLTSQDYYEFTGTAGERIAVVGRAKLLGSDPFSPDVLGLTVTLYDANQQQIAFQDDPFPRTSNDPTLYTVLPSDGLYYVRVEDCNAWSAAGTCYDPAAVTTFDYQLQIVDIS